MSEEITEFPTKLNPLPAEYRQQRREAMKGRKVFAATSQFVKGMLEAMAGYLSMRQQGVSREDAVKGLSHVLREVWPKQPTKYPPKCDACEDTGYEELVCRPYVRCQRETCSRKGEEWQHRYVVPCTCVKGQGFQPKQYQPEEALANVGKVSKAKRGWSRMGQ